MPIDDQLNVGMSGLSILKVEAMVRKFLRRLRRNLQQERKVVESIPGEKGSDWYDQSFENHEHWKMHYTESPFYFLWAVIADRIFLNHVESVLDIGCGPGQFAQLLVDKKIMNYTGIDFSKKRIDWAKRVCPGYTFVFADVFSSNIIDKVQYEAVTCLEFLEHVENDVGLIARIPTGKKFFGSVPNFLFDSHVRYFKDMDEVADRYESQFSEFRVDEFLKNSTGRKYFLLYGIKN